MTAQPAATAEDTTHDASSETTQRLAEIAARHRAATDTPWDTAGPRQPGILTTDGGHTVLAVFGNSPQDEADARFAAHARQDVPFLLARDASHTRRITHLERALAAVTDFAQATAVADFMEPTGIPEESRIWRYGYRAARQNLLDILRTTAPGVRPVPAGTTLFLAEYEGTEPELYTTLEAAQDALATELKAESPGRTWDWFDQDGGIFVQVYTSDLDDRPGHQAPGTVRALTVQPAPEGAEPQAGLPHSHADALTTDALGRPVCDGTRHRATRNCQDRAVFQLLNADTKAVEGYACFEHLGQMVATVNGGGAGSVLTRQIAIKE